MPNVVRVKITGQKELANKMKAASKAMAATAVIGAAYQANLATEEAIKSQIVSKGLVDTGALRDSIKRKRITYPTSATVVVVTGISSNAIRTTTVGGKSVVQPVPKYGGALDKRFKFIQAAYNASKLTVEQNFVKSLNRRLNTILKS
jgi:hypothetical protein